MTTYDNENNFHSFNDLPARRYYNMCEWYKHGKLHRGNDLPAIVSETGHKEWWVDGKRHRENGPAIIRTNGIVSWYKFGYHDKTL